MKTSNVPDLVWPLLLVVLLSGCLGNDYQTHTTVYEDGSLERMISTNDGDSSMLVRNLFGIKEPDGWSVAMRSLRGDTTRLGAVKKLAIQFSKRFASATDANSKAHFSGNARFEILSEFSTTFRWFYTDFNYSDTYLATIRFKHVAPGDYFTVEDYAFMDRYRALKVKTADDSAKFSKLNQRIDEYVEDGLSEEAFVIILQIVEKRAPATYWVDSTRKYKERIVRSLELEEFNMQNLDKLFADSLRIPIRFTKEDKVMFDALDQYLVTLFDEFGHSIEMPYDIIETNADSTAGRFAYWNNQGNLVKDFAMHTKSRKMNYWAIMATVFILAALIFVMRIRESRLIAKDLSKQD